MAVSMNKVVSDGSSQDLLALLLQLAMVLLMDSPSVPSAVRRMGFSPSFVSSTVYKPTTTNHYPIVPPPGSVTAKAS